MRRFGQAAITADPTLQNFRMIPPGTRIQVWAAAAAADQATLVVFFGSDNVLCSSYVPVEAAAGRGPVLEQDIPMCDVVTSGAGDLTLDFTFGTTNVDYVVGLTP